jgi:hypothetical protein
MVCEKQTNLYYFICITIHTVEIKRVNGVGAVQFFTTLLVLVALRIFVDRNATDNRSTPTVRTRVL